MCLLVKAEAFVLPPFVAPSNEAVYPFAVQPAYTVVPPIGGLLLIFNAVVHPASEYHPLNV